MGSPIKYPEEKKEYVLECNECMSEFGIEEQEIYKKFQYAHNKKVLEYEDLNNDSVINDQIVRIKKINMFLIVINVMFLVAAIASSFIVLNQTKENHLYWFIIPFLSFFIFSKLSLIISENCIKKESILGLKGKGINMQEYINAKKIKLHIKKRIAALAIVFLLIIFSCFFLWQFICNGEIDKMIVFAACAIIFLLIFIAGLIKIIKLVNFFKK